MIVIIINCNFLCDCAHALVIPLTQHVNKEFYVSEL